jgi:16S rRNA C967 or C1407 C5-methylase (RsmB/RsmF family)/NOL1/NOP2/fmu family ribosome biogenesis protein
MNYSLKMNKESIALISEKSDFFARIKSLLKSDAECQLFLEALEKLSKNKLRALRLNALKPSAEASFDFLKLKERVLWAPEHYILNNEEHEALKKTPHLGAGLAYVQDPAALEAPLMLAPQRGELVLDLCAAPGGKATFLGEMLGHSGFLLCNDVDHRRALTLAHLTARQGLREVAVSSAPIEKLVMAYANSFDAVLLDVPCSSESFFAKRKERRKDVSHSEVRRMAHQQKQLLKAAALALRKGGRIVYSTCTYSSEENEDVVKNFLEAHPDFVLLGEKRRWPHRDHVPGGYSALLKDTRSADFKTQEIQKNSSLKFLRWRMEAFDLALAQYIQILCGENSLPKVELNNEAAMKYLRGESLSNENNEQSGLLSCCWRGFPLGPAKAIENRLNNLLPKTLRML